MRATRLPSLFLLLISLSPVFGFDLVIKTGPRLRSRSKADFNVILNNAQGMVEQQTLSQPVNDADNTIVVTNLIGVTEIIISPGSGSNSRRHCIQVESVRVASFFDVSNPQRVCKPTSQEAVFSIPTVTYVPTAVPTTVPTSIPTSTPTAVPTAVPTPVPTGVPTAVPTTVPTAVPTTAPTSVPTSIPTAVPTAIPTSVPTGVPTAIPTVVPTTVPTSVPTSIPTAVPTVVSTTTPTAVPAAVPTSVPTLGVIPTAVPTAVTTALPTITPTAVSTSFPTSAPKARIPTAGPTTIPAPVNSSLSTSVPTAVPTSGPSLSGVLSTDSPPASTNVVPTTVGHTVAAGAVVASGAVAGQAMRLALIGSECQIGGGQDRDVINQLQPFTITIGNSKAQGTIIMNVLALITITLLLKVLSVSLATCFPKSKGMYNANDPDGFLRFPSAPLVVFMWLYQSSSLCSFLLLFYGSNFIEVVVGIVSVAGCAIIPSVLAVVLKTSVPSEAVYITAETPRHPLAKYFLGPGEWLSCYRDNHWVQKYASAIRSQRQETVWYFVVEMYSSMFLSLIASFESQDRMQCGHIRISQSLILFSMALIVAAYWPHCKPRDCVMSFVVWSGQGTALFSTGLSYYTGDVTSSRFDSVGTNLLKIIPFLLFIQIGLDVACEVFVFFSRRREKMQNELWNTDPEMNTESDLEQPLILNTPTASSRRISLVVKV
eukprot:TRINITY_DN561_c0_g1_i4.p1 TRINITY_DN561_c0_g1~~TRINITY_DN561_c0_g1_i4.p1  ORF type:complete len:712 (+),score=148.81 TRINITY_DN561_c0_g1_i4:53-2188(+)